MPASDAHRTPTRLNFDSDVRTLEFCNSTIPNHGIPSRSDSLCESASMINRTKNPLSGSRVNRNVTHGHSSYIIPATSPSFSSYISSQYYSYIAPSQDPTSQMLSCGIPPTPPPARLSANAMTPLNMFQSTFSSPSFYQQFSLGSAVPATFGTPISASPSNANLISHPQILLSDQSSSPGSFRFRHLGISPTTATPGNRSFSQATDLLDNTDTRIPSIFASPGDPLHISDSPVYCESTKKVFAAKTPDTSTDDWDDLSLVAIREFDLATAQGQLCRANLTIRNLKVALNQASKQSSQKDLQTRLLKMEASEAIRRHEVECSIARREVDRLRMDLIYPKVQSDIAQKYRRRLLRAKMRLNEYQKRIKERDFEIVRLQKLQKRLRERRRRHALHSSPSKAIAKPSADLLEQSHTENNVFNALGMLATHALHQSPHYQDMAKENVPLLQNTLLSADTSLDRISEFEMARNSNLDSVDTDSEHITTDDIDEDDYDANTSITSQATNPSHPVQGIFKLPVKQSSKMLLPAHNDPQPPTIAPLSLVTNLHDCQRPSQRDKAIKQQQQPYNKNLYPSDQIKGIRKRMATQ
ncbi:hypothetical protein V1511DRAFT_486516 [Dipodascopsis uninucleata]